MIDDFFGNIKEPVDLLIKDRVAWIILNNPRKRNVWSSIVASRIGIYLDELKNSSESLKNINGVVITGSGNYFSAGIDLKEVLSLKSIDDAKKLVEITLNTFKKIALFPKPIICAVNGPAYGLSVELFHVVDYVVSSNKATIAITGARFGIVPPVSVVSPRGFELRKISYIIMSGEAISLDHALRIGLIDEVVDHEKIYSRAIEIINTFSRSSLNALSTIRKIIGNRRIADLEIGFRAMSESLISEDTRKRILEFLNRR